MPQVAQTLNPKPHAGALNPAVEPEAAGFSMRPGRRELQSTDFGPRVDDINPALPHNKEYTITPIV